MSSVAADDKKRRQREQIVTRCAKFVIQKPDRTCAVSDRSPPDPERLAADADMAVAESSGTGFACSYNCLLARISDPPNLIQQIWLCH